MRAWLFCALLLASGFVAAQDNLRHFIGESWHPLCGINPSFDGQPANVPPPPFAKCRTLAIGFGADKSYPDQGVDALAKVIVALADSGGWEPRFGPLNQMMLKCRPALPLGFPVPAASANVPVCTVAIVNSYLTEYNAQPLVKAFRRFERNVRRLDLSEQKSVAKLRQAEAVIRATGASITFDDVAELLE